MTSERAIRERERRAAERYSAPKWPTYRLLPVEVPDLSDGRCRGAGDLFFPEGEGRRDVVDAAVRICRSCPLQEPCLDYATRAGERHGIWGGRDFHDPWRNGDRRKTTTNQEEST